MTELLIWISQFSYILEMLIACLVFTLPLKKRQHPILGFLLGAAISLYVSVLLGSIIRDNVFLAILTYLLQLAVVILPVRLSCDVSASDAIYGTLCAYAMQHFASSLYILLAIGTGVLDFSDHSQWITPASGLLYLAAYGGTYLSFYWLFARSLADKGQYSADFFQSGGLTVLVVPIALILSLLGKLFGSGGNSFLLCQVYAMLCSAFVLWVQTSQRKAIYWQTELALQAQLWRSQKEQYQLSREKIEIINRKCHDLKHQVAALRTIHSEQQREASLSEIEQAVMIYDAAIQTGNEVLDTVLTEKSLVCEQKEIKWTCMADGSQLGFLDPVDLYVIFGNALDNAIEGVQNLQESEKRVIAVTVFNRGQLAILQIENYYDRELCFENGLPQSTKGDEANHGFGMKSICRTVEKYNGSLSIHTEDHIFVLSIVFPASGREAQFG